MPEPAMTTKQIFITRRRLVTRVTHWVNVFCLALLLTSGLQILNAHPALYWGNISTFDNPLLSLPDIPGWATLPSYRDLAGGRLWHFFFAWVFVINGLVYLAFSFLNGHVRRDLLPTGAEIQRIGASLADHLRLRFPKGEEAKRYNVIQQITYLVVIFVLLPLMLVTGLCMNPRA